MNKNPFRNFIIVVAMLLFAALAAGCVGGADPSAAAAPATPTAGAVAAALTVSGTDVITLNEGDSVNETYSAANGSGSYTWTIRDNPVWLTIDGSNGSVTGTAPAGSAGTYQTVITVDDGTNAADYGVTLTVNALAPTQTPTPTLAPASITPVLPIPVLEYDANALRCYIKVQTPSGDLDLSVARGRSDSKQNSTGTLIMSCPNTGDAVADWVVTPATATAIPATATLAPSATAQPAATQIVPPAATAQPAATQIVPPAATAQPAAPVSTLDTTTWEYFAQFAAGFTDITWHGALIDKLDALYLGVTRMFNGGNLTTNANEVAVLWTGDYVSLDPTQGVLVKYLVEGDTGVFLLPPGKSVNIPTGFAYVKLSGWTGETSPRAGNVTLTKGNVKASNSIANNQVVPHIQAMMGQEPLFAKLDTIATSNTDARLRYGWYATVNATAGKTLVWTRTGMVGLGWAKITEADGKTLYVAKLDGELEVMHPFSGLQLCDEYPQFNTLPSVSASAAPVQANTKVANNDFATLVNTYRQTTDLYAAMGLIPSAPHSAGKNQEVKWNTFIVTSGNVSSSALIPVDWFNTSDGFRAIYFVMTDGVATFEADWAVIELADGPFSPEAMFPWWK